jgi:hypothetical protein
VSTLPGELEPRRTGGRPTRLTRETHDAIVTAIEQGAYVKIAAQAAGVGQSTLSGWLARGREAASARDKHNPEHRYCPACDLDREDDVRAVEVYNTAEDARELDDLHPARSYVVLGACPSCSSEDLPILWQLPDTEAPYLELLESVTRAQADAEVAAVAAWRSAWSTDWRAARDYLARTAPERWAGVTRVQMTTEEAERRIDDAVNEALLAVGIDLPDSDLDDLLDGDLP